MFNTVHLPTYPAPQPHSYVNTERKLDQAIVNGKFTRPNVQRTYYYIDYHDFTDVVKYRLAVMRQKLEATLKVVGIRRLLTCNTTGQV
jgi:transcription initiation factor IIE alpha subunit